MPNVKWDKLNELDRLIVDLSCIAQLQMIFELEQQEKRFNIKEFECLGGIAAEYLIEKEIETIVKIRNLTNCDGFIED